jgi:hypothetical protein
MTVPVYAVALVMMISFALSSDKLNERPWHIFVSAITGAVSCAIVADVDTVPVLRYVFFCFGELWGQVHAYFVSACRDSNNCHAQLCPTRKLFRSAGRKASRSHRNCQVSRRL